MEIALILFNAGAAVDFQFLVCGLLSHTIHRPTHTQLNLAANSLDAGAVKECLKQKGINVNAPVRLDADSPAYPPLIHAVGNNLFISANETAAQLEIARVLVESKADPDMPVESGCRALHWSRPASVTTLLLDAKAEIDAANNDGHTPLMCATWHGRVDAVRVLLARGANIELKNKAGQTVLSSGPMGPGNSSDVERCKDLVRAHVAAKERKKEHKIALQLASFVLPLSNYKLKAEELGRGFFAAVFHAIDDRQRHFAIKRFFSDKHADIVDKEIENITRIWGDGFDSPFLVRFYHTVLDAGDLRFRKGSSLVLELCEEGSLLSFIKQRADKCLPFLSAFELLTIALHLTSGLKALHGRNLVHKDIALRNILIARNEAKQLVFKIGDVGLCKHITQADVHGSGSILKVSLHTAPDHGQKADLRSDVFSLGLVLFELATMKATDGTKDDTDMAAAMAAMRPERDEVRRRVASDAVLHERYGKHLLSVIGEMLSEHLSTRRTAAEALHAFSQIDTSGLPLQCSH